MSCGTLSGRDVDKFAENDLTIAPAKASARPSSRSACASMSAKSSTSTTWWMAPSTRDPLRRISQGRLPSPLLRPDTAGGGEQVAAARGGTPPIRLARRLVALQDAVLRLLDAHLRARVHRVRQQHVRADHGPLPIVTGPGCWRSSRRSRRPRWSGAACSRAPARPSRRLEAPRAERHALIEAHVVADLGRLADHHARGVIDEEVLADLRPRIDVHARDAVRVSVMILGSHRTPCRRSSWAMR